MNINWKLVNGYRNVLVETPCFDEAYDFLLLIVHNSDISFRILDKSAMHQQWHTAGGINTYLLIQGNGRVNFIRRWGPTYSLYNKAIMSMESVFDNPERLFNQALNELEQKL